MLSFRKKKCSLCSTFKSRSIFSSVPRILSTFQPRKPFFLPFHSYLHDGAWIISFFWNFCIFQPVALFKLAIIDKRGGRFHDHSNPRRSPSLFSPLCNSPRSLLKTLKKYILIIRSHDSPTSCITDGKINSSVLPLGCAIYVTTKLIARTFSLLTGGTMLVALCVNIVYYKDRDFPKFRE